MINSSKRGATSMRVTMWVMFIVGLIEMDVIGLIQSL